MLNIALIGCGHIHTPSFIKRFMARSDINVAAVWDHDTDRAKKNAAETKSQVKELDHILADKDITTAVICSETNRHAELVRKAVMAGKNIYVEKPLGFTAEDATQMAKLINEKGVIFNTGYMKRGFPEFLFIKKLIEDGTLGKITRVRLSNCHGGSLGRWFDNDWRWMADPSIAGCGAFGDLGTHALDLLMWWFGKPSKVTADIKVVLGNYGDCDESGEALLTFPDGMTATLAAAWVDVADPVSALVSGTKGHVAVIDNNVFLKCDAIPGADGKTPVTNLPQPLSHAIDQFLDAAQGIPAALISADEAALRNLVMEKLYEASRQKAWLDC